MDIHQKKLLETADSLGIVTEDLSQAYAMDLVAYRLGSRTERIIDGRVYPSLTLQASRIADNKTAGKFLFSELEIPTPASMQMDSASVSTAMNELTEFLAQHRTVVCKPLVGTNGVGVAMGLTRPAEISDHVRATGAGSYIVEVEASGQDLRLQAVGGRLVAACMRQPTVITGDGQASIRQLIDTRNTEISALNPENEITIDEQVSTLLAARGYGFDDIIPKGEEVRIKKVANMAQGARAIDVTEEVHPDYFAAVARVANTLAISIFSLDFIAQDHRRPLTEDAWALELNARPAWLHHTFSERRQHDMPGMILKDVFGIQ